MTNGPQTADIGIIGLGVMGSNLALNIESKGFKVIGYDTCSSITVKKNAITCYFDIKYFVKNLSSPKKILLMVPAGAPVESILGELKSVLDPGDLIIDAGNSHYKDTEQRSNSLQRYHINYLGVGISGGENGARYGPSIMACGPTDVYKDIEPIFTAIAATDKENNACVARLADSTCVGHFVKMVHNSIEYAEMQLICEAYSLLSVLKRYSNDQISEVFETWNETKLGSFLINTSANVLGVRDPETGGPLVDLILDEAGQKGTGKWGAIAAIELGVPTPSLIEAVTARIISSFKDQRITASKLYQAPDTNYPDITVETIGASLLAAKIFCFAQGFQLLSAANKEYSWNLNFADIGSIWKSGCIIRGNILDDVCQAFRNNQSLTNLILDKTFSAELNNTVPELRKTVSAAAMSNIPLPVHSASLTYFDSYTKERLPVNLIQAQRDFFGAHGFQRIDKPGVFSSDWERHS